MGGRTSDPCDPTQSRAPRRVRVLAVDDQPLSTRGLQATLAEHGERFELAAVLPSLRTRPDGLVGEVALLELALSDGSHPRDNIATLHRLGLTVLVHSERCDVHVLTDALEAGAAGIVCKHHSESTLLDAILSVCRGEQVLPDDVAALLEAGRNQRPRLSAREVEVLNLLYQGLITKQAARRLSVSESTVKEHLKRIRQKYSTLGRPVSTRVQLLQVAHRDGFITAKVPAPAQLS